ELVFFWGAEKKGGPRVGINFPAPHRGGVFIQGGKEGENPFPFLGIFGKREERVIINGGVGEGGPPLLSFSNSFFVLNKPLRVGG
ncbi:hypothetical protein DVS31_11635, partial [Limosilactobacillus fermentum]|uniref:hypothetical protein n=1 Tax=Limosilactobacillus fermentum TaxID=1613 RepID=UPI001CF99752